MRISAKAEYACLAILALAERFHDERTMTIREIAEAREIPATFLSQILLKLKGAGLVISTRGSSGGYRLGRPPEEISLIDVLRVVDGYGSPSMERNGSSTPVLAHVWDQIQACEMTVLSGTSIAKLLERSSTYDWVI